MFVVDIACCVCVLCLRVVVFACCVCLRVVVLLCLCLHVVFARACFEALELGECMNSNN